MNGSAPDPDMPFKTWIRQQVEAEPYWFQRIPLYEDLVTPGWSDPMKEKMPYFGLPEDLTGLRVLDIGCAEGYFSFEAERRGAAEVIAIDSFPDSIRRFNICRAALGSKVTAFLTNVYHLNAKEWGSFDLVLFYGVFYHLRHPQMALDRIYSVCCGTMMFQTHVYERPEIADEPWAKYHPQGLMSGANKECWDPTVFWLFNEKACVDMIGAVGFENIEVVSATPKPFVVRAEVPDKSKGIPPDQTKAPWN